VSYEITASAVKLLGRLHLFLVSSFDDALPSMDASRGDDRPVG